MADFSKGRVFGKRFSTNPFLGFADLRRAALQFDSRVPPSLTQPLSSSAVFVKYHTFIIDRYRADGCLPVPSYMYRLHIYAKGMAASGVDPLFAVCASCYQDAYAYALVIARRNVRYRGGVFVYEHRFSFVDAKTVFSPYPVFSVISVKLPPPAPWVPGLSRMIWIDSNGSRIEEMVPRTTLPLRPGTVIYHDVPPPGYSQECLVSSVRDLPSVVFSSDLEEVRLACHITYGSRYSNTVGAFRPTPTSESPSLHTALGSTDLSDPFHREMAVEKSLERVSHEFVRSYSRNRELFVDSYGRSGYPSGCYVAGVKCVFTCSSCGRAIPSAGLFSHPLRCLYGHSPHHLPGILMQRLLRKYYVVIDGQSIRHKEIIFDFGFDLLKSGVGRRAV